MHRQLQICCFALCLAVFVTDTTATADLPPALQYPQLPQGNFEAGYQSEALVSQQSTQPTFHDLTHQGPHPSWLDLPTSPSPLSNVQRIPNPNRERSKVPSQQYPPPNSQSLDQSGYQQTNSANQSVPFIDIPTNNLPIHREEIDYNPYQSNGRPNIPQSGTSRNGLVTPSTPSTASTRQYTLPQIGGSNDFYTPRNAAKNLNSLTLRSGLSPSAPNQAFDTNSIRVQPSIYQQPPYSSDQLATRYASSSPPSNLVSPTSQPNYNQAYPGVSGQNAFQSDSGYGSQAPTEYSARKSENQPRFQSGSSGLNRFGDQGAASYPKISNQNQPQPASPQSFPSNQFPVQPLPYPSNSIAVQPAIYPQPVFEGPVVASPPTILVPSTPQPLGVTPIYYVSSSPTLVQPTTPASFLNPELSQTPAVKPTPSAYPKSAYAGQGTTYSESPGGRKSQVPNRGSTAHPQSQSPIRTTATPIVSRSGQPPYPKSSYKGQPAGYDQSQPQGPIRTTATPITSRAGQGSYPASSYGSRPGGYDQSQPQGPIRTTATPITSRAGQGSYPASSYGSQPGGYAQSPNGVGPAGKTMNRGQTKFSPQNPYGESPGNSPQSLDFPQSPGNGEAYPQPANRGQVKFSSSTPYPQTSTGRRASYPQPPKDNPDTYPRSSSNVPPQTFTVSSTVEPTQVYPQRQNQGRSNSGTPRTGRPQAYPSPTSRSFPQSSYPREDASLPRSVPPPNSVSQRAIPPQPSEPSYPQPGPPYQQPPSIAAQYNPNVSKSQAPNSLSYPSTNRGQFPSPSYSTNQVFGSNPISSSNSISGSNPAYGFSSGSTAAPSIYDYQDNPFLKHLIPGNNQGSSSFPPGLFQSSPTFSASVPSQRRNDVGQDQGLSSSTPSYGNSQGSASEPAQPTADCPHQFGYYRLGDQSHCNQYMNCANGVGYLQTCPEGLAFNELTIRCDWPDEVSTCDAESFLGFTCPQPTGNSNQDSDKPPNFPHPTEPTKYFSCQNGRPRLHTCPGPFNPSISLCQGAENEEQPQISNYADGSNLQFAPQPAQVGY